MELAQFAKTSKLIYEKEIVEEFLEMIKVNIITQIPEYDDEDDEIFKVRNLEISVGGTCCGVSGGLVGFVRLLIGSGMVSDWPKTPTKPHMKIDRWVDRKKLSIPSYQNPSLKDGLPTLTYS